ncbi:MAG: NUDIX domain-containing protein [Chloroflexota bacterium]|nr:NUDIX domain-containing protein [Dehalococcoidia bacterium]MDW8046915.1 NUDIX domain-containing protein [Chloroflexota bacterium]
MGESGTPRYADIERHHTATAYIVAQGRTLLIWHRNLGMWLPPGGHCELNEDPVSAAIREAREESGLEVEVVSLHPLIECAGPVVLPPPAVILLEDIVRPDQPYHQHIDHVFFTRACGAVDFEAPVPGGLARWLSREELLDPGLALANPEGVLVAVAEDVRLLGVQAIDVVSSREAVRA